MDTHANGTIAGSLVLRHAVFVTALSLVGFSPLAQAADGDGWDWMVAPYGWGMSISSDLQRTVPPEGSISTDAKFDDILDKFDGAFQVHAEGQGEHWGMFTDFTYLGLADDQDFQAFHTESDLDARLFELAAVWNPGEGRFQGLDVFAGLRYIDVDTSFQFDPVDPAFATSTFDDGKTYNDFMLGARYTWALSDRWGATVRGDGSFGDTEGTWNASIVGSYKMQHGAWLFGYRYLSVELDTGDSNNKLTLMGPVVGYGFNF